MSLDELFHVTVVPTLTQKGLFDLAFGISGVIEAAFADRLTSTVQGAEADPHVVAELHIVSGFVSEQTYFLPPPCGPLAVR